VGKPAVNEQLQFIFGREFNGEVFAESRRVLADVDGTSSTLPSSTRTSFVWAWGSN